mmetsp:Transcript_5888/g.10604  ORF Transcript_5888/g.10604 Transcript_5888/m.10604 type:complete len:325 (-) Transcript_5888:319-1293(-)|eukprot:CAMPEP_0183726198 /NCGR_PEP_ID=MMETSP0737-20130205/22723_1 /TAXON_ID=385413 /ORGANISM="Thalassiosira miniscula, Strain CCMP1093" /LENGTH=324 /DNA_ID=CAMNT_0025957473 /DNA_START=149 /DNA_END=1123 /DNA_ORIENTATION=+
MSLPIATTNHHEVALRSPLRTCRRTNRETIEAELFQLRSRKNGYVKSESLRLSTCPDDDDGKELAIQELNGGRRWKRRVEKMREVARKAKVTELRLFGRRSWWPHFNKMKSVFESPPTANCESDVDRNESKWDEHSQSKRSTSNLMDFPQTSTKNRQSLPPSYLDCQLEDKLKSKELGPRNTNLGKCQLIRPKLWKPKRTAKVSICDDSPNQSTRPITTIPTVQGETSLPVKLRSHWYHQITKHAYKEQNIMYAACERRDDETQNLQKQTRFHSAPSVAPEEISIRMIVSNENEKKRKKIARVAATVASVSMSSLGVAAAIILL